MPRIEHFDAIVIGSGQAGGPLAEDLARAGRRTCLVERSHMGGTCVNEGCTPTKTMVASARMAYLARRAADFGVRTGAVEVDMRRVRKRKRDIVKAFGGVSPAGVRSRKNLRFIHGHARFTGPHSIAVELRDGGLRHLAAAWIFIDTGARPARPSIDGLDGVPSLDSTSIMELAEVPAHLVVLGGGYIGLEFGQMFRRFGAKVTIVQRGDSLLSREDRDVAHAVAEILEEDGIEVLLETEAVSVQRGANGGIRLKVRRGRRSRILAGSHLLVATGRVPNTDDLDLPRAGIGTDERGLIEVDERLETSVRGVYALGDVKGGPAFTHISYDDYRIVRSNLLEGGRATTRGRLVPYTVFIDPQLGRVGLSESDARAQGRKIRVAKMGMDSVARALEVDEPRGFMKIVVDAQTDQILGAAVLGVEGGELMAVIEVAMMGKLPAAALREAIFAHPTLAESLNNVFAAAE
jgi:pyruvate/2-oxoglutarate dehydrogenase complex dihydrolipoamide dehydrogenase (E3) component